MAKQLCPNCKNQLTATPVVMAMRYECDVCGWSCETNGGSVVPFFTFPSEGSPEEQPE